MFTNRVPGMTFRTLATWGSDDSSGQAASLQALQHPLEEVYLRPLDDLTPVGEPALRVGKPEVVLVFCAPPRLDQVPVDPRRIPIDGVLLIHAEEGPGGTLPASPETPREVNGILVVGEEYRPYAPVRYSSLEDPGPILVPIQGKTVVAGRSWLHLPRIPLEEGLGIP